jgi:hypothetical protein
MKLIDIFFIFPGKAHTCLYLVTFSVFLVLISGCSDGPRAQYTELCLNIAKTAKQMQSCSCLAHEYGKVLTTDEFQTVNIMLDRAIKDLKERDGNLANLPPDINREGIDEKVFISAMQKITILQRSRICGYAPE